MSKLYSLTEDFFCEIIPADVTALVSCVIIAVFVCLDHVHHETGEIIGISRGTDLVVDNL